MPYGMSYDIKAAHLFLGLDRYLFVIRHQDLSYAIYVHDMTGLRSVCLTYVGCHT